MKIYTRHFDGDDIIEKEISSDLFDIAVGERESRITIAIRDGELTIRTLSGPIIVQPRASNTIVISGEDS